MDKLVHKEHNEHEGLVFYSLLSKNKRREQDRGECKWRTGGHTGIRAHDRHCQHTTKIESGSESETESGIWSGTLNGKRMGSGSQPWQEKGNGIWIWTLI